MTLNKLAVAAALAVATIGLAAPASADITVGPFTYGNDGGLRLNNFGYRIGYDGPRRSYHLEAHGDADGVSSTQTRMRGQFQTTIVQSYGTDYEGSNCILCQTITRVTPLGESEYEYNVLSDGVELEVTSWFGNFSLPREP